MHWPCTDPAFRAKKCHSSFILATQKPEFTPLYNVLPQEELDLWLEGIFVMVRDIGTEPAQNLWVCTKGRWNCRTPGCSSCEQGRVYFPSFLLSLSPALNNLCALFVLSIALCANCDRKIYWAFNYASEAPGKTMESGSGRRGREALSE